MNSSQNFNFKLAERFLENYADPPEDPLGELSHFEMGWRRFCFEFDHKVLIEIGDEKIEVFLDLDISMMIENNFPQEIAKLSQGQKISIDFPESWFMIRLLPREDRISCTLRKFGTSCWEKHFEFDRTHVLDVLRGFLEEVMQLAVDKGYITAQEKEEFISPAFSGNSDAVAIAQRVSSQPRRRGNLLVQRKLLVRLFLAIATARLLFLAIAMLSRSPKGFHHSPGEGEIY
jgi:hypothetical protein